MQFFFSRIDSSPYPGSCPCPIQPFPKNVHIGPLIGSKTDKGPCKKNSSHLHESTINPVQFKTEIHSKNELDIVVKPEIVDTHTQFDTIDSPRANHKTIDSIDRTYEKIGLVPQHHPNYTLNPKLLEQPEMSISPARGSIGPGIPKIQAGATQPLDVTLDKSSSNPLTQTPLTSRRARVGKSMAREMMLQSHPIINESVHEMDIDAELKNNICASTSIKEQVPNEDYEKNDTNTPHFLSTSTPVNGKFIKQEDVKKECDDDVLLISDKSDSDTVSSDSEKSNGLVIDLSNDRHQMSDSSEKGNILKRHCENGNSSDEIIDLDEDNTTAHVKRRKILEFHKNPNKKSPPNSYKNLIKPSDPRAYLCRADSLSKEKDQSTNCAVPKIAEDSTMNGAKDDSLKNGSCNMDISESMEMNEARSESVSKPMNAIALTMPSIADEFPQELSAAEEENFMSHLDLNGESISKGYCSDNEVLSRKKERLKIKLQKCEGRSRSESKKTDKVVNDKSTPKSDKSKPKSRKNSRDRSTSSSKSKDRSEKPAAKKAKLSVENITPSKSSMLSPAKKKSETRTNKSKTLKAKKSCDKPKKAPENQTRQSDAGDTLLDNESHINNNNNNSILLDNNNKMHLDALAASTLNASKGITAKKAKSRGSKFSNKKRHRVRHPKHIEEVIIPRQTQGTPRWSNGWNWQGEPFQGKVFLNVSAH